MKLALICQLLCVIGCAGELAAQAQTGPSSDLPELSYAFKMRWRLGSPAFAYEYFPNFKNRDPVIYVGHMAPRGMLVLSPPAHQGKAAKSIVLRSESVDITSLVRVAGAHYREFESDKSEYVSPDKLPKIKVMYEPLLPKTIAIPGKTNCVLLFQIGEGKKGEWAEGHWAVSVKFDGGKLGATLTPAGTGAVEVPSDTGEEDEVRFVYRFNFVAKEIKTEADKHNWLYFHYLDLRAQDDKKVRHKALEPLGELVKAYPTDPNLLYQRAQLLADEEQYKEAIEDIEKLKELLNTDKLRTAFQPLPGRERMDKEKAIAFLDATAKMWAKKASAKPATQPAN